MRRVARTLDQRPLRVEVRDGKGGAVSSILGDHQSYEQRILTALGLADLGEAYRARR